MSHKRDLEVKFFDGDVLEVEVLDDDVMDFLASTLGQYEDTTVWECEGIVFDISVDTFLGGVRFRAVTEWADAARRFWENDERGVWPPRELA